MVFNDTFKNISAISWRSVLLVEETGVHGENHLPAAGHWKVLSHNVVHLATSVVIGTDCIASCKSNYHTLTTTTAPRKMNQNLVQSWLLVHYIMSYDCLACYLIFI